MLVGFLGVPCSGKTTTAARLFASLKEGGVPSELVVEEARKYIAERKQAIKLFGGVRHNRVLKLELDNTDQIEIMDRQMRAESLMKDACGAQAAVVSDSSYINTLLYMKRSDEVSDERHSAGLQAIFDEAKNHYDLLFLCEPVRPSVMTDPNRIHSFEESVELHKALLHMVETYGNGLPVVRLMGDPSVRFSTAHAAVLAKLVE